MGNANSGYNKQQNGPRQSGRGIKSCTRRVSLAIFLYEIQLNRCQLRNITII